MRFGTILMAGMIGIGGPAVAQDGRDWRGGYAGVDLGLDVARDEAPRRIASDAELDRLFGSETRGVVAGGCPSAVPQHCRRDGVRTGYGAHAGYDLQFGDIVVGAVGEAGRTSLTDTRDGARAGFGRYAFSRSVDWSGQARLRAGYALGDTLPYVTGGAALARIDHGLVGGEAPAGFGMRRDRSNASGYVAGGGIDRRVSDGFAIGVLYTYTDVRDAKARYDGGSQLNWHSARVRASFRF